MTSPTTLSSQIRHLFVHGSNRYRGRRTYETVLILIDKYKKVGDADVAEYFAIEADHHYAVSTETIIERCQRIADNEEKSGLSRVYSLWLMARLQMYVSNFEENSTLRQRALDICHENSLNLQECITYVNWVLPALYWDKTEIANYYLTKSERLLAKLPKRLLRDPDGFGLRSRIKAHKAKMLISSATKTDIYSGKITQEVSTIYQAITGEILDSDHLRMNYEVEWAYWLLELRSRGATSTLKQTHDVLELAAAGIDAHDCNLCVGFFHEVRARAYRAQAEEVLDLDNEEGVKNLVLASVEGKRAAEVYGSISHPNERFGREIAEKSLTEVTALQKPNKIFLSHAGVNKQVVRRFKVALESLKFSPWLDEDAMSAGVQLDRALLQGMKASCAAVFFITPDFKDSGFLASEIDYAIAEQRSRPEDFAIITLVFSDDEGNSGEVPSLLRRFLWKQPSDELSALVEIVRAVPLTVIPPRFV